MITRARKRLVVETSSVIVILSVCYILVFLLSLYILKQQTIKSHIMEDLNEEFLPNYKKVSLREFSMLKEDDLFEVYDLKGNLLARTDSAIKNLPGPDLKAIQEAVQGRTVLKEEEEHAELYFPLSQDRVGRIVLHLPWLEELQERIFSLLPIALFVLAIASLTVIVFLGKRNLRSLAMAFDYLSFMGSILAHEIKTPLAALRSKVDVTLRRDRSAEQYTTTLEGLKDDITRLSSIVENLYTLTSVKQEPSADEAEKIDILQLIQRSIKDNLREILEKDIEVKVSEGKVFFYSNPTLIGRVIDNLITNAVRYTNPKGRISINFKKQNHSLYLSVENTYSEKIEINKILKPLVRGKDYNTEGRGLGLFVVNYIVRHLKGNLEFIPTADTLKIAVTIPEQRTH